MKVLGIETSCDDTSVAVVDSSRKVLASLVANQDEVHSPFGGVVPEIASRNHTMHLLPLIDQCLQKAETSRSEIQGVAVTNRPGLVGSLIVGLVTAKTWALCQKIPFLGVHHIEGHIAAPFLRDEKYQGPDFFTEGFLALVVSGGHTSLYVCRGMKSYELLGETIDDAAGEAFDKFAKILGLGFPGGRFLDNKAQKGDGKAFAFPRPLAKETTLNFSFSGLKTAGLRAVQKMSDEERKEKLPDLCASYQQAIVDVLVDRVGKALKKTGLKKCVVSGGVSANSGLRQALTVYCEKHGVELALPPLRYCTDNAAMIGLAGLLRLENGEVSQQSLAPQARAELR